MNYTDVYFARATHRGKTVADVATNTGIRSFEKWLAESPNVPPNDLQIEGKCFFRAIILSKKDAENKKIKELHVALDVPATVGDIVIWDNERWLIYQKERKVRETHQTFYMVRCNYYIKWVDSEGHLQGSWCYFVSSMDSKIKENFRTWNNLKLLGVILVRECQTSLKCWKPYSISNQQPKSEKIGSETIIRVKNNLKWRFPVGEKI